MTLFDRAKLVRRCAQRQIVDGTLETQTGIITIQRQNLITALSLIEGIKPFPVSLSETVVFLRVNTYKTTFPFGQAQHSR